MGLPWHRKNAIIKSVWYDLSQVAGVSEVVTSDAADLFASKKNYRAFIGSAFLSVCLSSTSWHPQVPGPWLASLATLIKKIMIADIETRLIWSSMGFNGGLKPLFPGKTYSRVYSVCYLENAQMLCGSCLFDQDINVGPSSWVSYLAGLLRGLEKESAEAAQRLEK